MQKKAPDSKAVSALLARLREASGCPGTLGLTLRKPSPFLILPQSPNHASRTLLNLPSSSLLRTHRRALSGLEARNISPSQRLVLQLRALLSRLEPGVRTKRIGGVPERTLLRRHRDFIIAKREQGFPVALLKRAVFAAWRSQVRLRV
jgi:hypothetical protein